MRVLFFVKNENLAKVKEIISKDPISRQSITIRDNKSLQLKKTGNYLFIEGDDKVCKAARKEIKEIAEEVTGKEKNEIIKKIEEGERAAMSGFGNIFG
jgi:polyribonucleotide nucleotidyltransferase